MRVNLLLAALLVVGISLLLLSPQPVSSQFPTTVHTCQNYGPDDTSTCGSGSSSSGQCSTSQVTHIGNSQGSGNTSYQANFTTCQVGDGTSCNPVTIEVDTSVDDSLYCQCTVQQNPAC